MNLRLDVEILGWLLVGIAGFQLAPLAAAGISDEPVGPWLLSAAAAATFGLCMALATRAPDRRMRIRDGFLVVSGAWGLACVFGAVPFVLADALGPVDALFETASGFTTTGSTVMAGLELQPRSLLLWRSMTQWLGGMGIIVFAIAVLPLLGIGGMRLFQAEVPGPVSDKLTPRVADTARRLWLVYAGLTAAAAGALWLAGMAPFDAVCHAMTTLATGGYSTRDASIGAWGRPAIEWVVIVFMLAAGTNFVLHWRLLTGRPRLVARDAELRLYLGLAAGLSAAIALLLWMERDVGAPIRVAIFQVVSLLTTTGYATADYEQWPPLAHVVVLVLLVLGGMAGSTAGGVKSLRVLLALRKLGAVLEQSIRRRAVRSVAYEGRPVPDEVMSGIFTFLTAYGGIAALATAVVAAGGSDLTTSISAALTALGNVGPGLGSVGPAENFAHLSGGVKLALALCMIAGRLEVFTVLVLLSPRFWR